jgi:DNA-binding NarL/FixJ family response regulator
MTRIIYFALWSVMALLAFVVVAASGQILVNFLEARILLVTQHDDPELSAAAYGAGAKGIVLKDDRPALRLLLLAT